MTLKNFAADFEVLRIKVEDLEDARPFAIHAG
jgi:hypothetical protein